MAFGVFLADLAVGPLAPLASVALPHGLKLEERDVAPHDVMPDRGTPIAVTAVTATTITFTNTDAVTPRSAVFRAQYIHTIQRAPSAIGSRTWQGVLAAGGGGFGAAGDIVHGSIWTGGRETHDSVTPLVVGAFAFDPTEYAITGTTLSLVFSAVAANGNPALTNYAKLVNVTDADDIATLAFISTSQVRQSAVLTVGGGAGQIDPSLKVYEVQIYLGAVPGAGDTIELYSAELRVLNTIT